MAFCNNTPEQFEVSEISKEQMKECTRMSRRVLRARDELDAACKAYLALVAETGRGSKYAALGGPLEPKRVFKDLETVVRLGLQTLKLSELVKNRTRHRDIRLVGIAKAEVPRLPGVEREAVEAKAADGDEKWLETAFDKEPTELERLETQWYTFLAARDYRTGQLETERDPAFKAQADALAAKIEALKAAQSVTA